MTEKQSSNDQAADLKEGIENTEKLIENLTKENEELKARIKELEKNLVETPDTGPPPIKFQSTCCHKKQKDCRHLARKTGSEGYCRMLKKEVNLKKPFNNCEYFRSPLPL